jgi:hypothetical protein
MLAARPASSLPAKELGNLDISPSSDMHDSMDRAARFPLPIGERDRVRGFPDSRESRNSIIPALSPNGERERTARVAAAPASMMVSR